MPTLLILLEFGEPQSALDSERPKPPFWFRPDTETETVIGRYFRPIPKPIPKPQSSEVVINIDRECGVFFPSK